MNTVYRQATPASQADLGIWNCKAAIVDLDGTLVDTLGDFDAALNAMLRELSMQSVERVDIERMIGRGSEHLIRAVLHHVGADEALYEIAWQSYQQNYLRINGQHSEVYEGAVGGLQQLKNRGLRLACLTNKPVSFARPLLEAKGLAGFFGVVFGGDSFERKKPDPLPLIKTCESLGVAPSQTLMIGDSSNDAAAARAAGCRVVLVTYGYNHGEPIRDVNADGFVDSIQSIGGWIDTSSSV